MVDEIKIYRYTQTKVLKTGEIKTYKQNMKKTYVKKPKIEHLPKIHRVQRKDVIGEEARKEIYAQHLRGFKQYEIAEDFGLSAPTIGRIVKREKELAVALMNKFE